MGLMWLCSLFFFFCLGPSLCLPLLVCGGAFACAGSLAGVAVCLEWGLYCLLVCWCALCPSWVFLLWRGPCNARGPWVSWTGSQCGPAGFVASGAVLPPCVWAFWRLAVGVEMTAAVAPFFTLFLPIKSPPLSTDRDTGVHMISLPMVTVQHFYLFNLRLCLPTKTRGCE